MGIQKFFAFLCCGGLLMTGCTSTRSTIWEYDERGEVVKKTISSESVISSLVASTRHKTVVMWEDGWAAYLSVSSGTMEDPTPHGKIFAGKVNKGVLSILPEQGNLAGVAQVIRATQSDLEVGLTTGIDAGGALAPEPEGDGD